MRLLSIYGVNNFVRRVLFRSPYLSNNKHAVIGNSRTSVPLCKGRGILTASSVHYGKVEVSESTLPTGRARDTETTSSKATRKPSSLRQVAVEAERSAAGIVKKHGRRLFIDPEAEIKTITAYCAAEQYNIISAARILKKEGYKLDPFQINLYPQVVHVQTEPEDSITSDTSKSMLVGKGDIFVFPSGTMVTWNVSKGLARQLLDRTLKPAANNLHEVETETLDYVEQPGSRSSTIIGDTIVLGTKIDPSQPAPEEQSELEGNAETNLALAKVAFSSGLSRSAKLSVLENLFENYFQSTKSIPTDLAKGSNLPFDRRFILSKTGELLNIRSQLNLYSELTDSVPDMLWESKSALGLESYFDKVGRVLDVSVRIQTLNQRMDYATEIASVLGERLSEKHGWTLEWYIIALIALELIFETYRFVKEAQERQKEEEVRELLKDVLNKLKASP